MSIIEWVRSWYTNDSYINDFSEGSGSGDAMSRSAGGTLSSGAALQGKPWYYGQISRTQCDSLLNQHGHDGDFLIRDSETNVSSLL